jgi:hypothetical protein
LNDETMARVTHRRHERGTTASASSSDGSWSGSRGQFLDLDVDHQAAARASASGSEGTWSGRSAVETSQMSRPSASWRRGAPPCAVQRAPHVELDPVGPHGHGRLEGEQRVLGGGGTGAPVGEDEGSSAPPA